MIKADPNIIATASTKNQIIAAADELIYQQGFSQTSFAHIADKVNISRGNFYYHFKNKNKILEAVIHLRMANTHRMLQQWEASSENPQIRIANFINLLITNQQKIFHFGCPIGNLTNELTRLDHPARENAVMLFTLYRTWLRRQFTLLGFKQMADQHALHLLVQSQGIATLASALKDANFLTKEVAKLHHWLASLG